MDSCIAADDRSDYYVIGVRGPFTVATLQHARKAAEDALALGRTTLVFDLGKTTTLDSAGLGVLTAIQKRLSSAGGRLCVIAPSVNVKGVLQSSGLLRMSTTFKSAEEAEAVLRKGGLQKSDRGFYVLFTLPEQFNIELVRPLRDAIDDALKKGHIQFVFDLGNTRQITSVGIGILANLMTKVKPRNGGVHLFGLCPDVRCALDISNILRIIPEYGSIDEVDQKLI